MEALHKQVMPFVLRRTKAQVLQDLPPKIIQDIFCDMSPLQVGRVGAYPLSPLLLGSLGQTGLFFLTGSALSGIDVPILGLPNVCWASGCPWEGRRGALSDGTWNSG